MDTAILDGLSHKPRMPRGMKDERKHGISETHIIHNHDGSHHITHHYVKPMTESTKHGTSGDNMHEHMESLHDHLEEMLRGKPSKEEMMEHEQGEE